MGRNSPSRRAPYRRRDGPRLSTALRYRLFEQFGEGNPLSFFAKKSRKAAALFESRETAAEAGGMTIETAECINETKNLDRTAGFP